MGWLTANRSEPQTAQQTTCCMVPQIAVLDGAADGSALGTPDGGIDSIDHSPPGDVAERQANGTLFGDTDGAADGAVEGAADSSALGAPFRDADAAADAAVDGAADGSALGATDGGIASEDHGTPEGVADAMGWLTARCYNTQTAQQTTRWMVPQIALRSAPLTASSTVSYSTPEGVADEQAAARCSETQTAQQTARWMVPQTALHSALLPASSTAQTTVHQKA